MRIVLLAGGLSPERDVSLSSGSLVANALIENRHDVYLLDLYRGVDIGDASPDSLFINKTSTFRYKYDIPECEPDLERLKAETDNRGALIGNNVVKLCQFADMVFIALHGDIGENGKLQAVFDAYGIKYTGTGYAGSLLAMDKDLAKRLIRLSGGKTADWIMYDTKADDINAAAVSIGLPCVVKPRSCGSSVGVSIAYDFNDLKNAVNCAAKHEDMLIIEKFIKGREFSVGILDGRALPLIEIIPNKGFYDYANKYQAGKTIEVCPADLPDPIGEKIQAAALLAHNALRLGNYSRIDYILSDDGEAYCLEANTLPGMTPTSLLPQEAAAIGLSYSELCEKIVNLAVHSEFICGTLRD